MARGVHANCATVGRVIEGKGASLCRNHKKEILSFIRYIAYCLPQTFACEALRGIMLRGWDITYMPVWRGFLVTIIWIVTTYVIFKELVNRDKVKIPSRL